MNHQNEKKIKPLTKHWLILVKDNKIFHKFTKNSIKSYKDLTFASY